MKKYFEEWIASVQNWPILKSLKPAKLADAYDGKALSPEDLPDTPPAIDETRTVIALGYTIITVLIIGTLGWAAFARLDSAVVGHATVGYETRRKVVQHLEGGMIQTIATKEGNQVKEGDVLFRLDDTQAKANLEVVRNQADALLAQEARLIAERENANQITFPSSLLARANNPSVKKVIDDQEAQFRERKASIEGQIGILEGRVSQYQSEINGLRLERESADKQLNFIQDELLGVRDLADKGLIPKTRWLQLEREAARLEGVVGRNEAEASKAQNSMAEMKMQIQQTKQKQREEVAFQLLDARQKLNDVNEKLRVAEDVFRRLDITAPRSGVIQNVRINTVGAVVRPGEPLAEVVPLNDELIIEAQISPTDIDRIQVGQKAEVRFPNFQARQTPVVMGQISIVSRDRLIDEATKMPYFHAQIAIRDTDIPKDMQGRLTAGMPAEVVVPTGERTVLQFLISPLTDVFAKTFREK